MTVCAWHCDEKKNSKSAGVPALLLFAEPLPHGSGNRSAYFAKR